MADLVEESVALRGAALQVLRPRDAEALLDEQAFEHEEYLPYWAELWPSGVALARRVAVRSLRGARVLELGCGLGLPSLAAALAGGRVLATDWSPEAIELLEENAARNGAALETALVDWASPRRSSSARRGTSCSPPTCSTSAATSRCCSTCCRGCVESAASCGSPTPAARPRSSCSRALAEGWTGATRPTGASPCIASCVPPSRLGRIGAMARSMWSGAISFGLVNVPVKLYSAVSRKTVRFHQLNADTGHRIAQKRVDSVTGDEVPYEKIVKGFELTKDRYVVDHARGARLGRAREDARDRHRGLRRPRGHRPDLLRPPVLPRPRQGRRRRPTGCCSRRCASPARWRSPAS